MTVIDTSHLHIFKFMAVVFMYFCQFPRRERVTFKEDDGISGYYHRQKLQS